MYRIGLLVCIAIGLNQDIQSAPCTMASLAAYEALGVVGCTIGAATLYSFEATEAPGFHDFDIKAAQVIVNPTIQPDNSIRLDFDLGGFSSASARTAFGMGFKFEVPSPPFCCYIDGGVRFGQVIDTDGNADGELFAGFNTTSNGFYATQPITSGSEFVGRGLFDPSFDGTVRLVVTGWQTGPSPNPGDSIEFDSAYIQVNIPSPEPGTGVLVLGIAGLYAIKILFRR